MYNPLRHAYNANRHESTWFSPFGLKFGRQSRLAVDAFLGIQPDSVTGHSQTEYAKKLRMRIDFAYQRATEEAKKQVKRYKVYYDQKVR